MRLKMQIALRLSQATGLEFHFWVYDRQAKTELCQCKTERQAKRAAKRYSHLYPGHEIAWGIIGQTEMLGYWRSETMPEFRAVAA